MGFRATAKDSLLAPGHPNKSDQHLMTFFIRQKLLSVWGLVWAILWTGGFRLGLQWTTLIGPPIFKSPKTRRPVDDQM